MAGRIVGVDRRGLLFTGNPSHEDTLTVGGRTYTFVTKLSGDQNEILIGPDVEDTAARVRELAGLIRVTILERGLMNPQATAGRIVHYYSTGRGVPRAAIVNVDTAPDGRAELTVFLSGRPCVYVDVQYSEEPMNRCWSWMPYQKAKAGTAEGNQSESAEPRPPPGPGLRAPQSEPRTQRSG